MRPRPEARRSRPARPSSARRLVVNGAFRGQRVTGQQRYAAELVAALRQGGALRDWQVVERRPPAWAQGSRLLAWAWVQSLALVPRGTVLLSLTSRAPVWARRHVVVVHDTFVITHPDWYRPVYRWSHALLLRWQLRSVRTLVAVSAPVADEVAAARPGGSVTVVPNAPAAVFRLRAQEGVPATDRAAGFFLAVGSLEPRKNLGRLLEAYGRLPEATRLLHPLLIVGAAGGAFRSAGLPPAPAGAEYLGYVGDDELAGLYRLALAVVFVSLDEGFGLPAVEALACGAALIVSDIPVFRWVCGELAAYADPRSVPAIEGALRQAVAAAPQGAEGEPETERRLRSDTTATRFTWSGSAATLAGVLERVAGG